MNKEKTAAELRRENLFVNKKTAYDTLSNEQIDMIYEYCEGYKSFLNAGKTERDAAKEAIRLAKQAGFRAFIPGERLHIGDRIYYSNRGKSVYFAVIGRAPLDEGISITAAHIDCPRLDLKPLPLYEQDDLAWFKTHYYGGIRKYQWVTIPMELRGVVALKDGTSIDVHIGTDPRDPVVLITDLLPHLAADQVDTLLFKSHPGEILNLLLGSEPYPDSEGSDRVKLNVMNLLNQKYGITEEDFLSAEISAVPAFPARDVGLDRSMVGGYGQDDRACAYAALQAIIDVETPEKTAVCVLADKEEIGSEGTTSMQSAAFDAFIADLCSSGDVEVRRCLEKSMCLSADVAAAFDPNYPNAYEKRNSALLNYGVAIEKYTGSRGKYDTNDANAEMVARVRSILDASRVRWQMAELGKVDCGGGGTVAVYMSRRNIDTMDIGVPVLSMHSPYEVTGKIDCYMCFAALKGFHEKF